MSSANVGEIPEGLEPLCAGSPCSECSLLALLVLPGFQTGLSGAFGPRSRSGCPWAVSAGQRRDWLGLNLGFLGVFPLGGES